MDSLQTCLQVVTALHTVRRRDHIIADVNKRRIRVTHKHDVELLTLVTQNKMLDEINGNALWMDAMNRDMENLKVA